MPQAGASIIGVGCICAAGETIDHCIESMFRGEGAPSAPTHFSCEHPVSYPVFEVPDTALADSNTYVSRSVQLLERAFADALTGAHLSSHDLAPFNVGVCIGTSVGASLNFIDFYRERKQGKTPDLEPIHRYLTSNPSQYLARKYGFNGPHQTVVNACSSGADAIGIGAAWVRHGLCDIVVTGGTDELSPISYNGFVRLMISSPEACKPFDAHRKGLNLGEGAGVLILATDKTAKALSCAQRGMLLGYGTCGDAHHLTAPHPEARGLNMALDAALGQAHLDASQIDCINVHGTGTPANDTVEGVVLAQRFPDTPFSATKGFTGHTLGAAGAIEAAFTLACMERGELPPSKGHAETDPAIGRSPVKTRTQLSANYGLSQSLAFGGNNSVLIIQGGPRS
ncbi:beta-ketoacyl-[acyl-carrier-protein] synthase family protein [Pseudodesulfovibrio sediminis]|uniref:3-oxoacyl-[acyl-carrier-protein] synthase 2 n=1 Tax=Pseudodesulfovibrio sediminis TaxID=2810563 RepID=A0ABN6ETS3_9BACT|nr:beta-ketoacyl-[acyl-carrier-protein] synthase family protein [Pseudodesulfovibrio sediminis]BCS88451.1 3-oxoacyl-[acyl-carrier-protein] synthase 2 [Pseudodesulfovibrio sediminis]